MGASAVVAGLAVAVLLAAWATPASAGGAPAARPAPGAVVQSEGGASNGAGELDLAMLILMIGVGGAIAVPIACRARIGHERSIRRFRAQLRSADVFSFGQQPIADHTPPHSQEPGPPGPRGRNRQR